MATNKLELYAALSYNPETDFEDMLMESVLDEAEMERNEALEALESYHSTSQMDALESLMFALEGKSECDCDDDDDEDDDDEDDDEKDEDAEESVLRSAFEAANGNFFKKLAAGWKNFVQKVMAFFSRVAHTMTNVATNFSANKLAKKSEKVENITMSRKQLTMITSIIKIKKELESLHVNNAKEFVETFNTLRDNGRSDSTVTLSSANIKVYMKNISELLKSSNKALKTLDKEVNEAIKNGDSDARSKMNDARSAITSAMTMARETVTAISSAVSQAKKGSKKKENAKEQSNDQPKENQSSEE